MSAAHTGPTPGFLVWRLSMKWRTAVDRAVAPLGLTHAQYSLLGSLLGMQRSGLRPSQRQLADHTGLEPLYVSKLARTLEAAGLVERVPDPADTRAVQLSLTDEGSAVTRRAVAVVQQLMDRLLAPLGGLEGSRAQEFARELTTLLDVPLDASLEGLEALDTQEALNAQEAPEATASPDTSSKE
ncbi:MarR family transcriptional regulator [Streptomyces sp. NPDC051907]|uniref:MarR family winged helix-turn-helix transcriptional regulator n=1 Tax=Streptomyces sp. NPDC051907 TaxID=3155284 RepID=UPI00343F804A